MAEEKKSLERPNPFITTYDATTSFIALLIAMIAGFSTFLFGVMVYGAYGDLGIGAVVIVIGIIAVLCLIVTIVASVMAIRYRGQG